MIQRFLWKVFKLVLQNFIFRLELYELHLRVIKEILRLGSSYVTARAILKSDEIRSYLPDTNNWQIGDVFRELLKEKGLEKFSRVRVPKYEVVDKKGVVRYLIKLVGKIQKDLGNDGELLMEKVFLNP